MTICLFMTIPMSRQAPWEAAITAAVRSIEAQDKDVRVLDIGAGAGAYLLFPSLTCSLLARTSVWLQNARGTRALESL
jgi:16S rRNA G527 N7-methylase RsmG